MATIRQDKEHYSASGRKIKYPVWKVVDEGIVVAFSQDLKALQKLFPDVKVG